MTTLSENNDLSLNPIINPPDLPHGVPALDLIKTEHFFPAIVEGIRLAKADIVAIKNNPAEPTFENTIEALEFSGSLFNRAKKIFDYYRMGFSNDEIIGNDDNPGIAERISEQTSAYTSDLMLDVGLFARVKAVFDKKESLTLSSEQSMLLENTYKDFVRNGALLNDKEKEEVRALDANIAKLAITFSDNIVESTAEYCKVITNMADLDGIPDDAIAAYAEAAAEKGLAGQWVIGLSPTPMPVYEFATNRSLREELTKARSNIAYGGKYDNRPVILEMIKLEHRRAQIFGYSNTAEYVLSDRMAGSVKTVDEFLERNANVFRSAAEEFLAELKDYAQKTDGITDFKPWDVFYYTRKLKEEKFNVDFEALKPYFELNRTFEGVRIHVEKLFNVSLKETAGKYPVNDPDVRVFEVADKSNNSLIGILYCDYYARNNGKESGAWMSEFRNRGIYDGVDQIPLVTNSCNFQKPAAGNPTFLDLIDEVAGTILHEFGHGLHALLSLGRYPSLNGTNVKWDFVELPSQLQENWGLNPDFVNSFAQHHITGEKLPADILERIKALQNFDAAYFGFVQTFKAKLDMKWYTTDPNTILSVEELEDSVAERSSLFKREAGTISTSFGHLFGGGYEAAYYSYAWAGVLEATAFKKFKQNGIYDGDTALDIRKIYEQGGTLDPNRLFIEAVGTVPDPDAVFERMGLLNDNKQTPPSIPAKKPLQPK